MYLGCSLPVYPVFSLGCRLAHQLPGCRRRPGRAIGLVFTAVVEGSRNLLMAVWEHLVDDVYPHTGAAASSLAKVSLSGRRVVKDLGAEATKRAVQTAIRICAGTSST